MLGRQGWKPRELSAVFVSRGPGSYTGLRVGLMSAKALAFATGCSLLAIDTFDAIAMQVWPATKKVVVIADAQQEKVYAQQFGVGSAERLVAEGPLRVLPCSDVRGEVLADIAVTGPGLHVHGGSFAEISVDPALWDPQPASLLRLGLLRFRSGERDDIRNVEPLYLRPSSAEEKWTALGR
jgi:tRNA threonylcarbamoyladenosine biosynthesis protein TsaB